MHKKLILKICTPQGMQYQSEESKIKVRSLDGVFELSPNYTNYTSILERSIVSVYKNNSFTPYVVIDLGILEFINASSTCTILTELSISIADIGKINNNKSSNFDKHENSFYNDAKKLYQGD